MAARRFLPLDEQLFEKRRPLLTALIAVGVLLAHSLSAPYAGVIAICAGAVIALLNIVPAGMFARAECCATWDDQLSAHLEMAQHTDMTTGVILLQIDDCDGSYANIAEGYIPHISQTIRTRLARHCPQGACIMQLDRDLFGVTMPPSVDVSLETALQLCKRMQHAAQLPIALQSGEAQISLSAGICLTTRMRAPCPTELEDGAKLALAEALRHGPQAVRSYSDVISLRKRARTGLLSELDDAISRGDIRAHFQPQVSALTGDITGFEALIRWHHPERGLIPPGEFLPLLERSGEIAKITDVMISQSLAALQHWQDRGMHVPRVGINFSTPELMSRNLVDHIKFELDRYDLGPDRLAIEVLETVVAGRTDDMIVQNLARLADMGTCIDLDDFGTGHASITNIQRFSIERIKIDRSFVKGIDQNIEQQNMVAAILTMAERLGLSTLAEGVESEAERRLLAELGCAHVQGFGIGRPMTLEDSDSWISAFYGAAKRPDPHQLRN